MYLKKKGNTQLIPINKQVKITEKRNESPTSLEPLSTSPKEINPPLSSKYLHELQKLGTTGRNSRSSSIISDRENPRSEISCMTMGTDTLKEQDFDDSTSIGAMSTLVDEKMKDFQNTLEMISEASMDPVIVCDESGKIKSTNRETLALFGYKLWELIGKNVSILMPQEYASKHPYYLERFRMTKMKRIIGQQRDGLEGLTKSGRRIKVNTKIQAITDIHGTVYLGTLKDVGAASELCVVKEMINNVLPVGYEERVLSGQNIADSYHSTAVIVQFVNFYQKVGNLPPNEIVTVLNKIFKKFDAVSKEMKLERVICSGAVYMAACGVTKSRYDTAVRTVEASVKMKDILNTHFSQFDYKICISTGNIVSAVIKGEKLSFDILGSPVEYLHVMLAHPNTPNNQITICPHTFEESSHLYLCRPTTGANQESSTSNHCNYIVESRRKVLEK